MVIVTWSSPSRLLCVAGTVLLITEVVKGLQCWHCIADNCADDPRDNYKATKKQCGDGESCQKVFFEMYSPEDNRGYTSVVRGCSEDCFSRNDFENCSKVQKNSRGCVRKNCCHDNDLCNSSNHVTHNLTMVVFLVQVCLILSGFIVHT